MRRLVTNRRLDEGLWASAGCCDRCVMVFGIFLLASTMLGLWNNEVQYFAASKEITRGRAQVIELPCSGSRDGLASVASGKDPVHLDGCLVNGLQTWTDDSLAKLDPDLEFLRGFRDNLPQDGVAGATFKVHLKQASGRRRVSWGAILGGSVKKLKEVEVYSPSARIGGYQATKQILKQLPGKIVPLRQSPNFQQEVSAFQGVQSPYSSKNMIVRHNKLYTSTSDPDNPSDADVMLWFTVADARPVSMLSRQGAPGHLTQWTVPAFKFHDLSRAELGSVPAHQMFDDDEQDANALTTTLRIGLAVCCWLATCCIVFPHLALRCHVGGCLRAGPLSLPMTFIAITTAWTFQRSALLTIAVSFICLFICLILASASDPVESLGSHFSAFADRFRSGSWPEPGQLVGGAVQWATQSVTALWGAEPEVGSRVRIRDSGLQGTILLVNGHNGADPMPYKVELDNGDPADWFGAAQLELIQEADSVPELETGETSGLENVQAQQSLPQSVPGVPLEPTQALLSEPLLPPVPPVPVDASPPRDFSRAVRLMALGMAVGLAVVVVAGTTLALTTD